MLVLDEEYSVHNRDKWRGVKILSSVTRGESAVEVQEQTGPLFLLRKLRVWENNGLEATELKFQKHHLVFS